MRQLALVGGLVVAACGGGTGGAVDAALAACTPAGQQVTGTVLTSTEVSLDSATLNECTSALLSSTAEVEAAFPAGTAPTTLTSVDFTVDRVVLTLSNPAVEFLVDDGTALIAGEEQICQGVAPQCIALVVHGTTRTTSRIATCPYTGPDPCLAP